MSRTSFWQKFRELLSFENISLFRVTLIFLLMIFIAAVLSNGVFLQLENLLNIVKQNTILIIVSLGQLLVIIIAGIDLSVGSVLALSSVNFVIFQDFGLVPAICLSLLISLAIGFINGLLVTYGRLPAFVVTLASSLVVTSVAMVVSKGGTIKHSLSGIKLDDKISEFFKGSIFGVPYPVIIFIFILLIIEFFLRTRIGHFTYAVGGNEKAAIISGIPVNKVKIIIFMVASTLAGIGGVIFVLRVGLGNPQTGGNIPLDSIAAVSIGGASLAGGIGTVPGTIIGVFTLSTLSNILNILNVSPSLQYTFKGIVILMAVYLNSFKKE